LAPGPTGDYGFDLDLHVPADMPAATVVVIVTASNSLGQTATTPTRSRSCARHRENDAAPCYHPANQEAGGPDPGER
jgi:hypothetical protein